MTFTNHCGDFNSHTGNCVETHLTQEELQDIPRRHRDPDPNHNASPPDSHATRVTSSLRLRGRMFLNMLNLTDYYDVIVNGRFEIPNPTSVPATFVRDRTTATNDTISRIIVDYFTID
jgi:hypothetical protein